MSELLPWSDHLPTGVDPATLDLVAGRSLIDAFRAHWASAPDAPALVDRTSTGDGRTVTGGELDERSAIAARRLRAAGIEPGAVVLLSGSTSVDFVVAYLGVLRAGATVLAVNSAYTEREVTTIVADARPVRGDHRRAGDRCRTRRGAGHHTGPRRPAGGGRRTDRHRRSGRRRPADLHLRHHRHAEGRPDEPRQPARLGRGGAARLAVDAARTGSSSPCRCTTCTVSASVCTARSSPAPAPCCTTASIPTGDRRRHRRSVDVLRCADDVDPPGGHPRVEELAMMRLGVSGSAPLPADLHLALAERIGRPPLERYGMSETAMLTSNPYEGERRAGSVGFPLPGVEARLAAGGEIEVRGPNVFARLPATVPRRRPRRSTATGSAPATSARSTPTATCTSSGAARS